MTIISIMILIVVWSVMLLSILANLGVDITALVASLGVGGIAVALAVQTVLGDVFASLSIGVDKPFEIGDFRIQPFEVDHYPGFPTHGFGPSRRLSPCATRLA